MESRSPTAACDGVPKRFGLILNPPALVIEWMQSSTGKIFHRRVGFNSLRSIDAEDLAIKVQRANQDLLVEVSLQQLVSLVSRFKERADASAEGQKRAVAHREEATLLPSAENNERVMVPPSAGREEGTLLPSHGRTERTLSSSPVASDEDNPSQRSSLYIKKSSFILENSGNILDFYDTDEGKLGQGTFGSVSKARSKATGKICAVKTISRPKMSDYLWREIELMKDADHPNIIKLWETFGDHHNAYLVVEYCAGGELFDKIVEVGHLTETNAARVMQQLLRAIHYLHKSGICHRDLKPQNLLLQTKDSLEKTTLKLIDFGVACKFEAGGILRSKVGTPYYIAPEVLARKYNELCDVWSCGVIMFLLLSGEVPFKGRSKDDLFDCIRKADFTFLSNHWTCVSEDAKNLIRMLLKINPEERFNAEQALNHVWVKSLAPRAQDAPLPGLLIKNLCDFQAMNNLKKSALHIIAGQVDEQQIRDLRAAFEQLDANQDGFLTVAEYREGLAKAGLTEIAPNLRQVMESVDMNHNDVIDYAEFLASALDAKQYLQEDLCWSAFRVFDRDGNGRISLSELATVLQSDAVERAMGSAAIKEVLDQVDSNGDGEIDFSEFMAMMRSRASALGGAT